LIVSAIFEQRNGWVFYAVNGGFAGVKKIDTKGF